MREALLLVAHPDDEIIFAGALLLTLPRKWTMACLSYDESHVRGEGFARSAYAFARRGVEMEAPVMLGREDTGLVLGPEEYAGWREKVREQEFGQPEIFTHNRFGEYGHPHHMAVAAIALELFAKRRVWHFLSETALPQEELAVRATLPLHDGLGSLKRMVMDEVYPSEMVGIDVHQPKLIEQTFDVVEYHTRKLS